MRTGVAALGLSLLLTVSHGIRAPAGAQHVARAPDVRAAVAEVFASYDRPDAPGCALGVFQDGETVYSRGFGMANLEYGIPIDDKSVFRIASVSKQFTAAAAVLAAQEGALSLDDDIRRWLPELPEYATPITIRMLLNHTSGIRDYLTLADLVGLRDDDWYTNEEALALIARQRHTNFTPGSEHLYSNSGYFLISQIIPRATGRSLRQYAEEKIFGPLGMDDTHFHDDHTEIVAGRASGYAPVVNGFRVSMTTLDMVGDGGVFTTVEDLRKWDRNFYDPKVGGRSFVAALLERGVLSDGDTLEYALGLEHGEHRGLPVISHGGAFVGFRAQLIRFPVQRLSVATLCNVATADPTALSFRVADLFLADFLSPEEVTREAGDAGIDDAQVSLSNAQLARWVGLYRGADEGDYVRLELQDGALTVAVGPGYPLVPTGEARFRLDGAPIDLSFEGEPGHRTFELRRPERSESFSEVEPAALTPEIAASYAGRWRSEELGTEYRIEADGDRLRLERGRGDPIPLQPTVDDEFLVNGDVLTFERGRDGAPTAFTIDAGRVRGIRFERAPDGC